MMSKLSACSQICRYKATKINVSTVLRFALLQLDVGEDKAQNVMKAISKISQAIQECKPRVVALSECFNCLYGIKYFRQFSEIIPGGFTSRKLSECARIHGVYIIGGTIPERDENGCMYNTCTVWDPCGDLIAKYRKMHLFNVDIPGGLRFREADILTAGNEFTTVEVDGHKIGIAICYDLRFEELAKIYRNEGCKMLIYPGAFNCITGPMHWELLQRARAVDNQVFVASISPSRDENARYVTYGYSMVVDPWGNVIASAREYEEVLVADIDFCVVDQVREQLPTSLQRRSDLYATKKKTRF